MWKKDHSDVELDYHITFPTPTEIDEADVELIGDSCESCTKRETVVVILGWGGCVDKHLSKYSTIYDVKGCITIRYSAPNSVIFNNIHLCRPIARQLLEVIDEYELTDHDIVFHVFSNAGSMIYRHVSDLLRNDPDFRPYRVKGVVFDSGPTQPSFSGAANALNRTLGGSNVLARYTILFLFALGYFYQYLRVALGFVFWRDQPPRLDTYEYLRDDPAPWPQLYFFSRVDEVCSERDISALVATRRAKGYDVTHTCWDDSPHVSHFRVHRESYVTQCYSFLQRCTASPPSHI